MKELLLYFVGEQYTPGCARRWAIAVAGRLSAGAGSGWAWARLGQR